MLIALKDVQTNLFKSLGQPLRQFYPGSLYRDRTADEYLTPLCYQTVIVTQCILLIYWIQNNKAKFTKSQALLLL